jgi:class 3 adenylate cyclase/tetratricopeptide (TPR) repeat protein
MPTCARCGQVNPSGFRFCGACGSALPVARHDPRLERKVITVLFCDLVGFTASSDLADPEDVGAMLRPFHARVRVEIERLGGTLDKLIGDGVMAVFGAPVAHEDDPERAVRCALRILDAIEDLNATRYGPPLAVRIGIMTGEALVALEPDTDTETVVGDVVNTASRLESAAPTGAAVIGASTERAVRALFDLEALDPVRVKGKAEPLPIWRVRAVRSRTRTPEPATTPLIGRTAELAVLARELEAAIATPAARLVTLTGAPGIGKSRLLRELAAHVDARPELIAWREGRCLPYGDGISFWALGEIVKAQAGILESDDGAGAAAKLGAALDPLFADQREREWVRARLAALLGLVTDEPVMRTSAGVDRGESFTAWRRFLEAIAERRPLVMVVEDLHWADPVLLDFIDHLLASAGAVPLLVVATARPELLERRPSWGGELVRLGPLSDTETARLTTMLLGRSLLPAEVQSLLLDRAGGNPLYAGEFVRLLTDRGLLVADGATVRLAADAEIPFPDTVQALIAARLDTLPAGAKDLLQDAAVLGRVFWSGGLAAVSGRDADTIAAGLEQLIQRGLIRAAPDSAVGGQREYAFSHALVRDVAYAQLPRRVRAGRHRAAAEWLSGLADSRAVDLAELVAHHATSALDLAIATHASIAELAELRAPARRALVLAGDRTIDLDAARALGYYTRACELWPAGDPGRAGVLVKLADATHQATGHVEESGAALEEAIAEFAAQGDRLSQAGAMERLVVIRFSQGDTRAVDEIEAGVMALLDGLPPGAELPRLYASAAGGLTLRGRPKEALALAEKAIELADRLGQPSARLLALDARGLARCEAGDLGGLTDLRAALEIGLANGIGYDTAVVYNRLAEPTWLAEGPQAGFDLCEEMRAFCHRRGLAMDVWIDSSLLTMLYDLGPWDEVLAVADRIIAWERERGARYVTVSAQAYTAQVLCWRGQVRAAGALVDELLPACREIDDLQALVPALVTAALVGVAGGDRAAATGALDQLDRLVAERSGGGWYRAQYLADLARVAVAVGRPAHAAELAGSARPGVARQRHGATSALAAAAEANGEIAEAVALYDRAARDWGAYGHTLEHGLALLGAGRCRRRAGADDEGTRERLDDAARLLGGLGAAGPAAEAARLRDGPASALG